MYHKGSLTVEGSIVISICMIVIGLCLLLAFDIYRETIEYLQAIQMPEIDAVEKFKRFQLGKEVLEEMIWK